MKIKVEISDKDLKRLVVAEIRRTMGEVKVDETKVSIETRSTQNFKSTWETADFRASIEVDTLVG